jgi:hypothetical protein
MLYILFFILVHQLDQLDKLFICLQQIYYLISEDVLLLGCFFNAKKRVVPILIIYNIFGCSINCSILSNLFNYKNSLIMFS